MNPEQAVAEANAALQADSLRIEFHTETDRYGTYPTAQMYTKKGARWHKAGPLLVVDPGASRADLLNILRLMTEALHNTEEAADGNPQTEVHQE